MFGAFPAMFSSSCNQLDFSHFELLCMDELPPWETITVGIYREIITLGFLRCRISFIRSTSDVFFTNGHLSVSGSPWWFGLELKFWF